MADSFSEDDVTEPASGEFPVIRASFLRAGYFPKELPPCFSTELFAEMCEELDTSKRFISVAGRFTISRPGGLRRQLAVVNPISQVRVAAVLADRWGEVVAQMKRSKIALAKPIVLSDRAVVATGFKRRSRERIRKSGSARYILRTDFAQFYASIYTHSFRWAIETKAAAKASLNDRTKTGELLDIAIRDTVDNQTKGIPVGPVSSVLASEIVLSAVDEQLQERFPALVAFRFMDDLEVFASDLTEAQEVLTALESIAEGYELLLNGEKTQITEAPATFDDVWRTELLGYSFMLGDDGLVTAASITAYFNRVFELSLDYKKDAVVGYALQRLRSVRLGDAAWSILVDLLVPCAVREPSSLRRVWQFVAHERVQGRELAWADKVKLKHGLRGLIKHHAPLGHGYEVAWSLWMMLDFSLGIEQGVVDAVVSMTDNASLILMQQLLVKAGEDPEETFRDVHERLDIDDVMKSADWLLAYETARQGWSAGVRTRVEEHDEFSLLLDKDVTFFNPDYRPPSAAEEAEDGEDKKESFGEWFSANRHVFVNDVDTGDDENDDEASEEEQMSWEELQELIEAYEVEIGGYGV
jgi:hypothetical protein